MYLVCWVLFLGYNLSEVTILPSFWKGSWGLNSGLRLARQMLYLLNHSTNPQSALERLLPSLLPC
jgi:hypothetical protein